ncbi:hypothetical protein, partial [Streptomyces niveus]|uniref:hypothetical protein n=1 Tax=Streptomyces niveus TaxID=193462 RepID=UPI00368C6822
PAATAEAPSAAAVVVVSMRRLLITSTPEQFDSESIHRVKVGALSWRVKVSRSHCPAGHSNSGAALNPFIRIARGARSRPSGAARITLCATGVYGSRLCQDLSLGTPAAARR